MRKSKHKILVNDWHNCYPSNWSGDALLINGDSRRLVELLNSSELQMVSISSPPFGEQQSGGGIAKSMLGQSEYPVGLANARVKKAGTSSSKSFFRRVAERNAALNAYWATLDDETKNREIVAQHTGQWHAYNALSEIERSLTENGALIYEPPTDKTVFKSAKETAFEKSGELLADWNRETAIDYETVFCMIKPEGSEA
jgi:hypothetical protein